MNDERQENGESWESEETNDSMHDEVYLPPDDGGYDGAGFGSGNGDDSDDPRDNEPLPSWERRKQIGYFQAGICTFKGILMEPINTFRNMPLDSDAIGPFSFAIIIGTIGSWIAMGIGWIIMLVMATFISVQLPESNGSIPLGIFAGMSLIQIAMVPVFLAIGLLISTAIGHIFLLIFGAGQKGFEATFRIVCYISGVQTLFGMIPYFGGFLAAIWGLACLFLAVREVHQAQTWRAACAVFVPPLLCITCFAAFWLSMMFSFSAAMPGAAQ